MQEVVKADPESIVEAVRQQSLDTDTFYNHVFDGTIKQYYQSVLEEIVTDLLVLTVERDFAGLEPIPPDDLADVLADAVHQAALIISGWFFKDPHSIERDIATALSNAPAEDIREARLLRRHKLLN